jgi:hypothetical protein
MDRRAYPGTGALDHALPLIDSLCGDVRKSPWGLLAIITFAHIAPEGGIGFMIYSIGYLAGTIFFAAVTITYLMTIIGEIVIGPSNKIVRFRDPLRIKPRVAPATLDDQSSTS